MRPILTEIDMTSNSSRGEDWRHRGHFPRASSAVVVDAVGIVTPYSAQQQQQRANDGFSLVQNKKIVEISIRHLPPETASAVHDDHCFSARRRGGFGREKTPPRLLSREPSDQ